MGRATELVEEIQTWQSDFYPRPPWGGRQGSRPQKGVYTIFLSTPSVGRATALPGLKMAGQKDFYPRPPWGGRPIAHPRFKYSSFDFYPRPPWGGRPKLVRNVVGKRSISIHALRGEGDAGEELMEQHHCDFYPRPPWGGRRGKVGFPAFDRYFYPRPPWGGRPTFCCMWSLASWNFYPRPPWGGRQAMLARLRSDLYISIHALRGEGDPRPTAS